MKIDNVKVCKMGNKLGICLSKFYFQKGRSVQIKVIKENKEKVFLAKFNRIIVLRKDMKNSLSLKHQDLITIELGEIKNLSRTSELFKENMIDMLFLIPEKTSRGYEIVVTEFEENNEAWLRIWYSHKRGSGKQLEIRRFIEIRSFGSLLGQYQAEGTKHNNTNKKFRVEFKNKLVKEHSEFLYSFSNIGIPANMFVFRFLCNPNKISGKEIDRLVKEFEAANNCKVKISYSNSKGIGFESVIRHTLLTEIILYGMDKVRNLLANSKIYSYNELCLADNFLAKLLTGDGTLDVRCKRRDFPELNIKIVDQDLNYLDDYSKILRNAGFHPRINQKRIFVKSSCSFRNLLYLYNIKAFKNSNNWSKLLTAIALCLRGRRYYTYSRFLYFADYEKFGTSVISKGFQIQSNMASDWLNNKVKENLIMKNNYNSWSLTPEGKNLSEILKVWSKDYQNLTNLKGLKDPFALLETLKIKKLKRLAKQLAESNRSLLL